MNRRNFIKTGALVAAGAATLPLTAAPKKRAPNLNLFSKPLHWIKDYDRLAEAIAKLGIAGIDLTVRPKGHVLPENVERDLPLAVKAAHKQGLNVDMMVTAVTSAGDDLSERVLKTAAQNGVKLYRMGYLQYDLSKSVIQSLADIQKTMEELAKLNQSAGLTGCYQNHHAWKHGLFGGAIWDLHHVLKGIDPKWMASQYDIRHAIAECTGSWSTGTRLIAPWIKSICLKDFNWNAKRHGRTAPNNVPAGTGEVPWQEYLKLRQDLKIDVPATVHVEWELFNEQEKTLSEKERTIIAIKKIKADCDFYKSVT